MTKKENPDAIAATVKAEDLFFTSDSLDSKGIIRRKVNCAEAILRAYLGDEKEGYLPDPKMKFSSLGYGKAPGGTCGAVYAGEIVLSHLKPGRKDRLTELFREKIGHHECRVIKTRGLGTCRRCVQGASLLIDELLKE